MPESKPLLVLVVPDAGRRSVIVGRLALAGIEVLTAPCTNDPRITPEMRREAILAIDEEALRGAVDALGPPSGWTCVVVLTRHVAQRQSPFDWLVYVDKDQAAELLAGFAKAVGD